MDYEAIAAWYKKYPGIRYDINYARGCIDIWQKTKSGRIIRCETYPLTKEELLSSWTRRRPILDKYVRKFIKKEKA